MKKIVLIFLIAVSALMISGCYVRPGCNNPPLRGSYYYNDYAPAVHGCNSCYSSSYCSSGCW